MNQEAATVERWRLVLFFGLRDMFDMFEFLFAISFSPPSPGDLIGMDLKDEKAQGKTGGHYLKTKYSKISSVCLYLICYLQNYISHYCEHEMCH